MAGKTRARVSFVFPHEFTEKRAATVRRRLGSEQTASCGYAHRYQNFFWSEAKRFLEKNIGHMLKYASNKNPQFLSNFHET